MDVDLPVLVTHALLIAVATYRLTRLITRDKIPLIGVPRELFVCRWGTYETEDGKPEVGAHRRESVGGRKTNLLMASLAYLWECDWCMSVWVGAGLTYATWLWPLTLTWVEVALVASALTGLLVKLETRGDK